MITVLYKVSQIAIDSFHSIFDANHGLKFYGDR